MTIDIMATPQAGVALVDPAGQVSVLATMCAELGIHGVLKGSQLRLKRSQELGTEALAEQAAQLRRWAVARDARMRGDLDAAGFAAAWREAQPWLNPAGPGGPAAPLMSANVELGREARGRAGAMLAAEASGIYNRLQRVAAEAVAATGALPKLPKQVWGSQQPDMVAVREGAGDIMRDLWRWSDRFDKVHEAARICRASGGLGAQAQLLDGAPEPLAFTCRNWPKAAAEVHELKPIRPPLKLRWMIDRGWQPGLWARDDLAGVEQEQRRPTPWGWLIPSPLRSSG
jgi:hypothetical protein